MKTKTIASIKIPSKVDDHGKRFKDNDLRIGTWNVRTLHRVGASAQLADALIKCKTDITAIQEMRWTGQGCKRLASCDLYYSCHVDKHEFGCGFVVNKRLRHLVSGFTPVNERIATIRIRAKFYTYLLNWPLQPFSQDYDLASHTIYVVCVTFIHKWRDLQFKVDSERQIFEKLFMAILLSEFLPEIC